MSINATNDTADRAVFISYSHLDAPWLQSLSLHLRVLQQEGLVNPWDDRQIEAGHEWQSAIEDALQAAKVAVLLITARFLTSSFITTEEVPRLLRRWADGELLIMPVILEACLWKRVQWLVKLQVRPFNGRPLSKGTEAEQAQDWTDICDEIAGWLRNEAPTPPPLAPLPAEPVELNPGAGAREPALIAVRSSQQAGAQVRGLAVAVADDPTVGQGLGVLRDELVQVSRTIESLTAFKEMHDELHNLEFQFLPRLRRAEALATEFDREEIERCSFDLEGTTNHLRAVEERVRLGAYQTAWIKQFGTALEILQTPSDILVGKDVRKAVSLLNRVLSNEPSRLSERMRTLAEALDLSPLRRALQVAGAHGGPAAGADDTNSVGVLETAMHDLVVEHDAWQRLETDLRLIDATLPLGLDDIDVIWTDIVCNVRELAPAGTADSAQLTADLDQVTTILAEDGNDRLKRTLARYRGFRRRAGQRFFRVDADLHAVFGKMSAIGEPLLLLLRTLNSLRQP